MLYLDGKLVCQCTRLQHSPNVALHNHSNEKWYTVLSLYSIISIELDTSSNQLLYIFYENNHLLVPYWYGLVDGYVCM
jgi:hypothetical protein